MRLATIAFASFITFTNAHATEITLAPHHSSALHHTRHFDCYQLPSSTNENEFNELLNDSNLDSTEASAKAAKYALKHQNFFNEEQLYFFAKTLLQANQPFVAQVLFERIVERDITHTDPRLLINVAKELHQ